LEADNLALGMNSAVCAPGANDARRLPGERLQGSLKLALDRSLSGLHLEPVKVRAIILDRGL
jgi:hypothetical protein